MAPKKAELAVKRAEAAQDLSPSALDFVLPLWGDVVQDSSVQGVLPCVVRQGVQYTCFQHVMATFTTTVLCSRLVSLGKRLLIDTKLLLSLQVMKTPLAQQCCRTWNKL